MVKKETTKKREEMRRAIRDDLNAAAPLKKHETLARVVMEAHPHIKVHGDELWRYDDGLWVCVPDWKNWLRSIIRNTINASRAVFGGSDSRLLNETITEIITEKRVDKFTWDNHGKIALLNGLYDVETDRLIPHAPKHNTTRWVEAEYNPKATCPRWHRQLAPSLDERHVAVLQEAFGLSIFPGGKPKDLCRAVILQGTSNTGKSQVLSVWSHIICKRPISPAINSIDSTHGTMPFLTNAPWVLHEAFNQNKWEMSATVKQIIEGGDILVNRKNGSVQNFTYNGPVIWATNAPPSFQEMTKAIVNRLLIFNFNTVFDPGKPVGVALEAQQEGFSSPSEYILAHERSGILNWAIEGLKRALARGYYEMTQEIKDALEEVHLESNMTASWFAEGYAVSDPDTKIRTMDAMASFCGYYVTHVSNSLKTPTPRQFSKALQSLGLKIKRHKIGGLVYFCGMRLTGEGLAMWQLIKDQAKINLPERAYGTSPSKETVNREWGKVATSRERRQRVVEREHRASSR